MANKFTLCINYHNGKKTTETFDNKEDRDRKVEIIEEGLNYRQSSNFAGINQELNKSFVTIEDGE